MLKAKTTNPFDSLNPAQRRAATFGAAIEGKGVAANPALILAGAGTGKTGVLAHRIAHLVLDGADPSRMLLLTSTRRAAQEIIARAQSVVTAVMSDRGKLGDRSVSSRLLWHGTFHSVGARILRLFAKHLGLDPTFTALDGADGADLMEIVRHGLGFAAAKGFPRKEACLAIYSCRVNTQRALKQTLEEQFPPFKEWEQDLTRLYREYVALKQQNNLLDIDDLLLYWHTMMRNPALALGLAKNFDHVLVDDYQETSILQVDIIHALKPDGKGVIVAGDEIQAIYPLRAPAARNILGFAKRFAADSENKVETITLVQNYRSTQAILDCANALMTDGAREHRRALLGARPGTQKPLYVSMEDAETQAEYVVSKINASRDSGGSLKRHAVLFRSPQHSEHIESELNRRNIPYVKYGDGKFLEAAHVKDALSVLRWAENPRNTMAGLRALKLVPGIGSTQAKRALDLLQAQGLRFDSLASFDAPQPVKMEWKQFATLMEKLADPTTPWPVQLKLVREWYKPQLERLYESSWARIGDLQQLEHWSARHGSRERFLTELALDLPPIAGGQVSQDSKDEDYVVLSTIRAAKGQEWDCVYILNVADGNFPSRSMAGQGDFTEEERRLLYVAMTRARSELHLCAPLSFSTTQQLADADQRIRETKSRFMTERVLECVERSSYRSLRGAESLRASEGATVDVAAQLKEMW